MSVWFIFALSVLASYRLALMFSKESGPGHIFKLLRLLFPAHSKIREGIECLLCESVWWSALITLYLALFGQMDWGYTPLFWLASSAGACIIHFQFNKEEP